MLESRVRTVEQLAGELGSVRLELETLGAALREGLGCWRAAGGVAARQQPTRRP